MLKKIILIGATLVFAFGVLAMSVYRTSTQTLASDLNPESLELTVKGETGEEEEAAEKEPVEYNLTYPGILPGHFLYPLKMIRDRVWLFLTTDSLKKAELLLKLADKRIWSAQMLVDKDDLERGVSTATKAEKYLEQAIDQEKIAREEDKETMAFLETLSRAALKHEEILLEIKEKVPEEAQPVIDSCLEYVRRGYREVIGILTE